MTGPAWEVRHGDALDVLDGLPPGGVDLVVTDPPYMIGPLSAGNLGGKTGGWGDMMNAATWYTAWYSRCVRVLRRTGALWTCCNWRSLPVVMRAASDSGLPVASVLVWDKRWIGPGGPAGLRHSYEMVALLPMPGFAVPDRAAADVWAHRTGPHKPHGHPAEKPVALFARLLHLSGAAPGWLVVDPFCGSGTAGVAAAEAGCRFLGVDTEARWVDVARARLAHEPLPLPGGPA